MFHDPNKPVEQPSGDNTTYIRNGKGSILPKSDPTIKREGGTLLITFRNEAGDVVHSDSIPNIESGGAITIQARGLSVSMPSKQQ